VLLLVLVVVVVVVLQAQECTATAQVGVRVMTFYSPEAVIMTSEDFAPQRRAMHQSSVRVRVRVQYTLPAQCLHPYGMR
jgi:hypothetical protein